MSERFTVRVGAAGAAAAPDLWGLFIEDLNDALDGGLNAELVRNGDFEFDPAERDGFHALTGWTATGGVEVRTEAPLHPNNGHYAHLTGPAAIENGGWDGVRAVRGGRLRLSLFARADAPTAIAVQACGGAAIGDLAVEAGGWRRLELDLEASADGRGELRLAVPAGATVDIDAVSLRPIGADGEPLTFRADLLRTLQDLKPSFIRFPGGCLAHGYGLDNMYHWKRTIGPRHEREQIRNVWGYHQSRQIGYVEYFELCLATGATPVPIVAAGVCCQNSPGGPHPIPESEMDAYIQDVLDLVEFANGGTDTPWGAKRAELGHPEPFGVRYLGIGNEDQITDDFRDRYARIEDAVQAAHPEITVIGTSGPQPFGPDYEAGWAYARERGTPMVDEHGYQIPRWFHQNIDRYQAYDPDGAKVYLGEYAARSNTVRSALAEAAYMIGLERRPEVVRLASYAPLLARAGHTQWTPDLIYFNADEVLPSASYHVQQMFGAERGTRVHAVELEGAQPVPVSLPREGTVRLRSGRATVAYSGVVLNGHRLPDVITRADGEGVLLGGIDPGAAELEFEAVQQDGVEGFTVVLGPEAPQSFLEVHIGGWQNKSTAVARSDDGIGENDHGPLPWRGVTTGVPVRMRIRLDGPRVQVWVDGELRHDYEQDLRPEQRVVAGALSRDGGEYVVRMVNATGTARTAAVALPDPGPATAAVRLLAGAGPDEGRPHEAAPVTPVDFRVEGDGGFDLELPPWSFATAVVRPLG
ncbi:alpha-L-arabinofuranosidase C-terminal domain-containing protein [Glycomyces tritici]|uniref:non-reducing end alpha-L-arabinofuranosidase n=1 Tax=Glycomyces tritici TaxID=2665176 RepID=A0ABT7YT62_9ACTN|nr:alpha-L-arabinofuranosidase C-terminal domain-containing protein [Glycomyces tritici]MDN3241786.1 alpha-L-arabinofuranosidase C-terminal domain-containing protein [Glycomyces tritici]